MCPFGEVDHVSKELEIYKTSTDTPDQYYTAGAIFMKGLNQGFEHKFKTFVINICPKSALSDLCHRQSGTHKEFALRLIQGHNFKSTFGEA